MAMVASSSLLAWTLRARLNTPVGDQEQGNAGTAEREREGRARARAELHAGLTGKGCTEG
jgi:hypothetical protein